MFTERIIWEEGPAREKMIAFLAKNQLGYEQDIEYSYCLMDGDQVAAAGSLAGPVLKCIAVDPTYRSMGLSAQVVSALCQEAAVRGHVRLFLFTKPENQYMFSDMGFYTVGVCPRAALMENRRDGLKKYAAALAPHRKPGSAGAIVLNANPFTLGHLHLVEHAASQVDHLHLFVVSEDKSQVPAKDRLTLVKQGVQHLLNVSVHRGDAYIISAATFPSYFLKATDEPARIHAQLDVTLFGKFIAPALGITRRFAGEEPLSPSTLLYNQAMMETLPPLGVDVTIIPRKEQSGQVISASRVRALWQQGDWEALAPLVPQTTLDYLRAHPIA